jgi:hypothetical protein
MILTKPIVSGKWAWRRTTVTTACCSLHSGSFAHFGQGHGRTDTHIQMLGMCAKFDVRYGDRYAPASSTTDTSVSKAQSRASNIQLTPPMQRRFIWRTVLFHLPITQTSERRSSAGYRVSCAVMTEQQTNSTHQASTLHTEVIWSHPYINWIRTLSEYSQNSKFIAVCVRNEENWQCTSFRSPELSTAYRHHIATVETVTNSSAAIYAMSCATESCLVNSHCVTYKLTLWNKWPFMASNQGENWAASKIQAAKGLNLSGLQTAAVRIYPTLASYPLHCQWQQKPQQSGQHCLQICLHRTAVQ